METIFGIICSVLAVGFFLLPSSSMEEAYWERQNKLMKLMLDGGL